MKILLVITKSEIGGAQVFVLNLVRELICKGYTIEVAAGDGDYLTKEITKLKIKFHYLTSLKRNLSLFSHIKFSFDFYKLVKNNRYDIIHLNSSNTLMAVAPVKMISPAPKVVFTFHGLSFLDKDADANPVLKFFGRLYFKFFLRMVDKTVFVSQINYDESIKDKTVKDGEVVYNGLDEKQMIFLNPNEARKYFTGICGEDLSNSFIIGSTGRIAYQKNYEFLIHNYLKIKNAIPNLKIIIIGEGPNLIPFRELISKLGIQKYFHLVGPIQNSYKYIHAFDVFTLPSRYEGLSISLIEAIFAEIPILASDVGGNCEIVEKNSPQLFRLNDVDDYISKLMEIKENKQKYIEINKQLKNKFNLSRMVDQYESLYKSLIEK